MKSAKKIRRWTLENVQTRNVSDRLNELSTAGYTIFGVYQSVSIGGSYEVVYYIDKLDASAVEVTTLEEKAAPAKR